MRKISCIAAAMAIVIGTGFVDAGGSARAEEGIAPPPPRITFHTNDEGVRGVKLRLFLQTTPDKVWDVVTNHHKAAQLFKAITAIKNSPRGTDFREYHIDSILGDKLVICRINKDNTRRRLHWKRVDGSLLELMGWYHVSLDDRYPGYTRVDYASYIDPGFLGRTLMTNRGRRRDVNYMIEQFRRFTETGPAK